MPSVLKTRFPSACSPDSRPAIDMPHRYAEVVRRINDSLAKLDESRALLDNFDQRYPNAVRPYLRGIGVSRWRQRCIEAVTAAEPALSSADVQLTVEALVCRSLSATPEEAVLEWLENRIQP